LNKLTIKWKLILVVIISLILTASTISGVAIYNIYSNMGKITKERAKDYKDLAYESKKSELTTAVKVAINTIDTFYKRTSKEKIKESLKEKLEARTKIVLNMVQGYYAKNRGKIPKLELENSIKEMVKKVRFGKDGYFWINDLDTKMVMHPIKPSLDGKNLANLKDTKGTYFFKNMVSVAKESGFGFVDYFWPKPGFQEAQEKISYVVLFKPFKWVIGTGVYVDNVTEQIQKEALDTISQIRFGKSGKNYFWINDLNTKMVMHPINPSLNGKDLSYIKDTNGKKFFSEMVNLAKTKGKGYVNYVYKKPSSNKNAPKISYIETFKEWGWVVGAGVYTDDIEEHIKEVSDTTGDLISEIVIYFILITIGLVSIMSLAISFIANREIVKPISSSVIELADASEQVASASEQIASASTSLADGATRQAHSVEEIAGTLEQATSINEQNTQNTKDADNLAKEASVSAQNGYDKMNDLMKSMDQITSSSEQISNIIRTIEEIAFQTNLLALNAAVEAARAGENGLGFAVVAEEVKNLANRSAHAAKETTGIIEQTISQIKHGNHIAKEANQTFDEILNSSNKTYHLLKDIAQSMQEQTSGMHEITTSMEGVDRVTQQNAANSEQTAAASEELSAQALSMKDNIDKLSRLIGEDS